MPAPRGRASSSSTARTSLRVEVRDDGRRRSRTAAPPRATGWSACSSAPRCSAASCPPAGHGFGSARCRFRGAAATCRWPPEDDAAPTGRAGVTHVDRRRPAPDAGALRTCLEAEPDITVVGEAGDGAETVRMAQRLRPDVVVMDVRMPIMDGIEATRRILALPRRAAAGVARDDHLRPRRVHHRRAAGRGERLPREGQRARGAASRGPPDRRRAGACSRRRSPGACSTCAGGRCRPSRRRPAGRGAGRRSPRARWTVLKLAARGLSNADIAVEYGPRARAA